MCNSSPAEMELFAGENQREIGHGCGRRFRAQKSRLRANNQNARVIARRRTARRRKWSCSPASTVRKPTDFVRAVRATKSPKRGDCFGAQEKRTASLGELKEKGNESVCLFATVDGKKLVLATLLTKMLPQIQLDMVFDRDFQLSHNWKNGSVYFYGNRRLFEVSRGKITAEGLELMAANKRHKLCVLLGPTNTWNSDKPIIFSVIQVYIEGKIDGMPYIRDRITPPYPMEFTLSWLGNPTLLGANIVNIYTSMGEAYDCTAVKLLSRYYNGDAAEDVLQEVPQLESHIFAQLQRRHWSVIHYLGVIIEMDLVLFDRWISYGFSLISISKYKDGRLACCMIKLLRDNEVRTNSRQGGISSRPLFNLSCDHFMYMLSTTSFVDPRFALRILDISRTPFTGTDRFEWHNPYSNENEIVEVLNYIISGCGREKALQYIPAIARFYFQRWLQNSLSSNQKLALLYLGLQGYSFERFREIINISEEELDLSLRKILEEGYDYLFQETPKLQAKFARKHKRLLRTAEQKKMIRLL
ncbi:UPF0202 protein [Abeliophyllum distichum]|uniref:UPF0202 protein n=1 Tax=Abeliophyllum distichum TaxID=126358 RepID=A0ABD1UIM8_9LAMI